MHGLAHPCGASASWTKNQADFKKGTWIISSDITLKSIIGKAISFFWFITGIGLISSGVGLVTLSSWWIMVTQGSAILSLVIIGSWLRVVLPGAKLVAQFDITLIIALASPGTKSLFT
jgi:hypothetical protein